MSLGRGEDLDPAAGGPARHVPVLRDEVMQAINLQPNARYIDATFGAGGYTKALLACPGTRVLALDRDPEAIAAAASFVIEASGRLELKETRFSRLAEAAEQYGLSQFDGIVLDIGVSSMQLDEPGRGFSFRHDGPLDMRMEGTGSKSGPSAADLLNQADEETLANIFYYYGEERASRKIAKAIIMDRAKAPFTSTAALAGMIARVAPGKPQEIHPATRVFQALRIAVNDELGELVKALFAAERLLKPGGRLAVVTFHSLEDRLVKKFFASGSGRGQTKSRLLPGEPAAPPRSFSLPPKQPVLPTADEVTRNPRARSAKLRYGIRTEASARSLDENLVVLASLPMLSGKER
jgi:16S rRNA (cytosine1402-N4)-methyltransferase